MPLAVVAVGLAALLVGIAITLAIHEIGHAFVALVVGARNVSIRWGTPSRALGAHVVADLPDTRGARAAFFASGPLTSALFGALCVFGVDPAVHPFVSGLGCLSGVFALVCAVGSDGRGVVRSLLSTSGNDAIDVKR